MSDWHPFEASNKPGTCLWCGRKLRRKHLSVWPGEQAPRGYHETGRESKSALGRTMRSVEADKLGDYLDDAFCGLRCGYQFGARLADLGRRLEAEK